MILLRSAFSGRQVESALIAANIPYVFIGGTKLLEAAHVKDLISMLRVTVNYLDELAWIRFLTLWDGIGDAGAGKLVNEFLALPDLNACIEVLDKKSKVPKPALDALRELSDLQELPEKSIDIAFDALSDQLQKSGFITMWLNTNGLIVDPIASPSRYYRQFFQHSVLLKQVPHQASLKFEYWESLL